MGVKVSGQTIMAEFLDVKVGAAKISGFIHAASGHDSDKFVKKRIAFSAETIETFGEFFGRVEVEIIAVIFDDFFEGLKVVHFGLGVSSQDTD
jgi:hypothetical protein